MSVHPRPHLHIIARRTASLRSLFFKLGELWQYRELVYFLTWRDIKVRYKQTLLGASWAILQPLLSMLIFSLFLGRLVGVSSDGLPYPLFNLAGMVPWTFFANGVSQAANSLVGNANMIKKIYFPRLAAPLSAVAGGGLDFALAFGVLLVLAPFMGRWPSPAAVLWVIPLSLLLVTAALGVGLWLTALNVQFRDVRYAVPFLVQAWFFASPVTYPSSLLAEPWRTLYAINPMVGVVEGFRFALFGGVLPGGQLLVSALSALALLVSGLLVFNQMEKDFADVV